MSQSLSTPGSSTLVENAKSITLILESELGENITLYDAESGEEIRIDEESPATWRAATMPSEFIRVLALRERPVVMELDEHSYRAILPIREGGLTRIIGVTTLPRFTTDKREQQRLEKWCSLLLEKLTTTYQRSRRNGDSRQRDQAGSLVSAFDVLLRNSRLHGDSARFQRNSLKAVLEVVGVESAIWVWGDASAVMVTRRGALLSNTECRQLATKLTHRTEWDRPGVLIDNAPLHPLLPEIDLQVRSLLAIRTELDGQQGQVILLNKVGHSAAHGDEVTTHAAGSSVHGLIHPDFQRSDAALLASFVTLMTAQLHTATRYQGLKDLIVGLTRSLTSALDAKDPNTAGHSERVARMAVELGKELEVPEKQLNDIYLSGLLHDIGKIGVRDDVLSKTDPLTDAERLHIQQHPVIGYRILSGLTGIEHLLDGVLYHHEQYNGAGYPEGLRGTEIPEMARIIAVADGFDAMTSDRPYRKGMSLEKVDEIFRAGSGKQWDPKVMEAFWRCKDKLSAIRQIGIGDSLREALDGALHQPGSKDDASLQFTAKKRKLQPTA